MQSICYVVPYFGSLPNNIDLWLMGCRFNPTIDWLLLTDDHSSHDYPRNVHVRYTTFDEVKSRIQSRFDFQIHLTRGWELCKFKPAYGEVFADELEGYDFWGFCDIDLMWGDLRKFYVPEILDRYERIGFQGHSTLVRNTPEACGRYRTRFPGFKDYQEVFSSDCGGCFDETGLTAIYRHLKIPFYHETNFAHLRKYTLCFSLEHLPKEEEWKNERQVFTWSGGRLFRHYLVPGRDEVRSEEYAYLHFWCRPMTYAVPCTCGETELLIVPDRVVPLRGRSITPSLVRRYTIPNPVRFYTKAIWANRHKLSAQRIIFNIKGSLSFMRSRGH